MLVALFERRIKDLPLEVVRKWKMGYVLLIKRELCAENFRNFCIYVEL